MSLTEKQRIAAERAYIIASLTNRELEILAEVEYWDKQELLVSENQKRLQSECTHPLIMRVHKNEGISGGWDRSEDVYWTSHHCSLCYLRWHTNQRWDIVGERKGHPNDTLAAA